MTDNTFLLILLFIAVSCNQRKDPADILHKTINAIDTIKTIFYKQDMVRTNPENVSEVIFRYREFYYKRMKTDSIIGAKAHLFFYDDDKKYVWHEDIYDGNRVIRKNNRDSTAIIFDLIKYPEFNDRPFWGHNSPYTMQYMFKFILENQQYYNILLVNDTLIQNVDCYQIKILLENKTSMPGYEINLKEMEGNVSTTLLCIDKSNFYPKRMRFENYSKDNPEQIYFTDQIYYGLKFNSGIDESTMFDISEELLNGFEKIERKP